MARRLDIELTSTREDGTWTWRVAGARQPKGVIDAKLLESTAKVGDILHVEVEQALDGVSVTSVLRARARAEGPQRIEIVAPKAPSGGVTTTLVEKRERRPQRRGAERGERTGRATFAGEARTERAGAARAPGTRPERRPTPAREGAPTGDRTRRAARPNEGTRTETPTRPRPTRVRPARLSPKTVHRDALIDTLAPEQRPIAEQLALGGLSAVRRALAEEQVAAKAAGRPPVGGEAMIALAEQLAGSVREAVWLDRAEATLERLEDVSLRDLRAAVAGAAPRGDAGRELHRKLKAALDERLAKLRVNWETEITRNLDEGKVLQALRLSARPPEPSTRFPAGLVARLSNAAGEALNSTTPPERWLSLLEAAAASPLRRSIKPAGLAADDSGAVRKAATVASGHLPGLSKLLGLRMPPPPGPLPKLAPARPRSDTQQALSPSEQGPIEETVTEETTPSAFDMVVEQDDGDAPVSGSAHLIDEGEHPEVVEPADESPAEIESE